MRGRLGLRPLGGKGRGDRQLAVRVKTAKTLQSLELEGGIFVDADSTNNRWTAAAKTKAE